MIKYEPLPLPIFAVTKEEIAISEGTNQTLVTNNTSQSTRCETSVQVHVCEDCAKEYQFSSGLRQHMAAKHPFHGSKQTIACKEAQCTFTCNRLHLLHDHLKKHGIKTEIETITFNNKQGTFLNNYAYN